MKHHYPEDLPLSEEDQAALDAAQTEYDELAELIESGMADDGQMLDFDQAYERYLPALEGGIRGGTCARQVAGAGVYSDEWEDVQ
ncbi:hypothetical protein CDO25_11230 [Sinorhizobium meliloti]|nr:hypothetical protein CDO25_11230 [Sinorhizobium meliloti]